MKAECRDLYQGWGTTELPSVSIEWKVVEI